MAGYKGYSMSNNAVSAYESGEKPLSRWTKTAIMNELDEVYSAGDIPLDVLEAAGAMKTEMLKESVLVLSSWHHTSAKYNRTNFYKVCPDLLLSRFGYREAMFCNTPDGEKAGTWTDRNENGIGFKSFTATTGEKYSRNDVAFSRFGFVKDNQ